MDFSTRNFAGLPVAMVPFDDAVLKICQISCSDTRGVDVHLINAYSIALSSEQDSYRECLESAFCNFPDGKPLSLLTRFSDEPLSQVRGPRLFEAVLDRGRTAGLRHFLLGSTPETLNALVESIERKYPGTSIVGIESPPFRKLSAEEVIAQDLRIKQSEADIVWVGLGTPKQDFEAQRLASKGFNAIAVGAAFDFTAGVKKEAPAWMTAAGFEWLFRFATEPRRLWRRYLIGNIQFLIAAGKKR